tara:strand:+ start:176 stop:445 length:270 start_codon:yes stop_codon:yes gene_type:complete
MQNKITFNKHNVTNGTKKARVFYSINGRTDGRNCVTIYAKDLTANLKAIFADAVNNTEVNTDYFETSKINFFETSPFYAAALKRAQLNK